MKAIIYKNYGPPSVLQLVEVDTPVPGDDEVRVRIMATSVNSADWRLRKADPFLVRLLFGFFKPKVNILGNTFSGVVDAVGNNAHLFKPGDEVFGLTDISMGTYAEYKCMPQSGAIALKPSLITHEEAATIPFGAHTAWHFFKKTVIKPGDKILIYGASGAVGTAAVQLARQLGAHITAVCSTSNIDLVKSLGANLVIDYTKEKITTAHGPFDVIFETVNKTSVKELGKLLKPEGVLILGAAMGAEMIQGVWITIKGKQRFLAGEAKASADDLKYISNLVEKGYYKPVVDRMFSFEQMAEAHTYVEAGHKRGNVAIRINGK
jgi:NADPH:quinone reductase-like Zn-dependent oxidoreductase